MFSDFLLWIDFVCLIPVFVKLVTTDDGGRAMEFVQALTPLRLIRLSRRFQSSRLLFTSVDKSLKALAVPLFLLLTACCFFGGLLSELHDPPWQPRQAEVTHRSTLAHGTHRSTLAHITHRRY